MNSKKMRRRSPAERIAARLARAAREHARRQQWDAERESYFSRLAKGWVR